MEEFAGIGGSGTRIDEVANVGIAGGNYSIKWRDNALVTLQLLQSPHICLAGIHGGLRSNVVAAHLVRLLLRDRVLEQQRLPPITGNTGKVGIVLHAL